MRKSAIVMALCAVAAPASKAGKWDDVVIRAPQMAQAPATPSLQVPAQPAPAAPAAAAEPVAKPVLASEAVPAPGAVTTDNERRDAKPSAWVTSPVFPGALTRSLGVVNSMSMRPDTGGGGTPMSLEAALTGARSYSLEIRATKETTEAARISARAAMFALGPKLDVTYGKGKNEYSTVVQPNATSLDRRDHAITLRQPLFDYAIFQEIPRRAELRRVAGFDSEATELRVGIEGVDAYLEALRARLAMDYAGQYEAALTRLLDYMSRRTDAGAASRADLDRVKARQENARSRNLEARGAVEAAAFGLERTLGYVPVSLAIPSESDLRLPTSAEMAQAEALEGNAELRSARAQLEAMDHERKALRGRFLPKVEFEVGRTGSVNSSGLPGTTRDNRAMVLASMSLFSSGVDLMETQVIARREAAMRDRIAHAERMLRHEIRLIYSSIEAIGQRINPAVVELEANRRVVDTYDAQLLIGGRSLLDLLDAFQRLYESRIAVTQLLVADAQQRYALLRAMGRLQQLRGL